MRVNLLKESYLDDKENLYQAFIDDKMNDYISDEFINLEDIEPFPVYMGKMVEKVRNERYLEAFRILQKNYMHLGRDMTFDKRFWDSLFFQPFREYTISMYPNLKKGFSYFKDILVKKFDWENYIYKCVLFLEYLNQNKPSFDHEKYYDLFLNNLDTVNYIIKYSLTRNGKFLFQILDIINRHNLTDLLKKKITHRTDLGKDERYSRRVIYEFNKNYPVMMFPDMDINQIEDYFFEFLNMYHPIFINKKTTEWETL